MAELSLFSIAFAFFVVTVSPGQANIAVATVSMSKGRQAGLLFGAGLSVGLAFWGLIAATGLGAVLQTSAFVLNGLKIAGGAYLLWLGYQSWRSAARQDEAELGAIPSGNWFLKGLVLNLSNPKAVVAWMAALSVGLGGQTGGAYLVLATGLCMVLGCLNYTGYALLFSLRGVMAAYRRLRRWIDGTVAVLFSIAGLGLIRSAFARS